MAIRAASLLPGAVHHVSDIMSLCGSVDLVTVRTLVLVYDEMGRGAEGVSSLKTLGRSHEKSKAPHLYGSLMMKISL